MAMDPFVSTIATTYRSSMDPICAAKKSLYRCSRCQRRYCSSDCFRSPQHIQCSEEFFKQCVTQELLSQRFDDSSKHRLLEILKRNDNQLATDLIAGEDDDNDDNESNEVPFEVRFKNLDISDSQQLWDQLSDSERQEFSELLKSGKIGDLVDVWTPWWTASQPLVTPLGEPSIAETSDNVSKRPQLASSVTQLNDLISVMCPAVVNSLFSYCYICRIFNGEYDSIEAIDIFVQKCPQLCKHINCDDLNQSLQMCVQEVVTEQPSYMAIQLLHDLKCLIDGPKVQPSKAPEYVLRAFSDLVYIINNVKKKCPKTKRKELELLAKKLEFFMSWSVANGVSLVESLIQINLLTLLNGFEFGYPLKWDPLSINGNQMWSSAHMSSNGISSLPNHLGFISALNKPSDSCTSPQTSSGLLMAMAFVPIQPFGRFFHSLIGLHFTAESVPLVLAKPSLFQSQQNLF
ncbi:unnamed protein product [Medioppia subpectinata]|uniref:HIT-type domain-containing protein n=1 Tax=Medioppia subpectinata TaxID=1979941 RepID=A0A7R9KRB3_9ACAR|nr:unnamed protein product [Medioppia subpectinata]CAG2107272.1 unnamed protein product [Medioppia subpectinata]